MNPGRRLLAVGLALLGAACGPPQETAHRGPDSTAPSATDSLQRIEIPLDDTSGREASLARNFYFVLDGSGSMDDPPGRGCEGDQRFATKMEGARWAVRTFLEKVPEDVRIGLYVFSRGSRGERVPLGVDNRERFLATVDNLQAGGGTPLAQAITDATDRLVEQYQEQLGYGEYRIVVITDGRARRIPEAATYAGRYGMPIYAIGLCIREDHPLRRYAVSYRAADDFQDLAEALEETLAELPSFDPSRFEEAALGGDTP